MIILLFKIISCLVALGWWWYKHDKIRYSNHPPGPTRFPLIGSLPQLLWNRTSFPSATYKNLADTYGDVMFIKVGQNETVVLTSFTAVHEMLNHVKSVGSYQYEFIKNRNDNRNLGLIWGHGEAHRILRRFTMRHLPIFGKSKELDCVIQEEVQKFLGDFEEKVKSNPTGIVHVEDMFSMTVVNVLWRLVTGKSYDLKDPKMLRWVQLNSDWLKSIKAGMDLYERFPWLHKWFPNWTGRSKQKQIYEELYAYGKELLDHQRNSVLYDSTPRTFANVFARKIEESRDDPDTTFNDAQFVMTILDLFLGGSETSSNTLNFGILYMMLNPEVQEKVHIEIHKNIPINAPIDSTMKALLPYTQATILEMLRHSTVIPMPSSRMAIEDFYFQEYLIKQGTALMFNLHALHFNEDLWGDPMNFRPERFLTLNGNLDQKMAGRLKSFGAGKRVCIGKSLAETTMFLYFASAIRHFKFEKIPGGDPSTEPVAGLTSSPKPFDVRVILRNQG